MKTPTVLLLAALLLFVQVKAVAFNGTCDSSSNTCDPLLKCESTKCVCADNYIREGTECKIKAVATAALNCSAADVGHCVTGADCNRTSGNCVCRAATHDPVSSNGTCQPKADSSATAPAPNTLGGSCTASSCTDTHAECSTTTSKCVCVTDFVDDGGACKLKAGTTTATCSTKADCVSHSDCSSGNCNCDAGYKAANGLCAEENAGGRIYGNWAFLILATAFARFLLR